MQATRRSLLVTSGILVVAASAGVTWRAWEQDVFTPATGLGYEGWTNWRGDPAEGPLRCVRAAILAANPHNTQPWKFRITQLKGAAAAIDLYADLDRNIGTIDPFRREMFIGLGCALENLVLAARAYGYRPEVHLLPSGVPSPNVARVTLTAERITESDLFRAIPFRHTHRGAFHLESMVAPSAIGALTELGQEFPAVKVRWLTQPQARAAIAQQVVQATEAIIADADQSQDSARWFRHSASDIHRLRDGLTLDAQALAPTITALAKLLPDVSQNQADQAWLEATKIVQVATAPAFGILAVKNSSDAAQRLLGGRVWQRMHLWAVRGGLAMQPLNQLPERADRERQLGLPPRFGTALRTLLGAADWEPLMPFRLGYPVAPVSASPRRDVLDVMVE